MRIRLAKAREGKPNVLTCFRDDGSSTWTPLGAFLPLHDLTHYAVETTLGYRDAFFGLVARGWDVRDFSDKPRDPVTGGVVRSALPPEAVRAEYVVGTLDAIRALVRAGAAEPAAAEALFYEMIAAERDTLGVPLPEIAPEQFREILCLRDELADRWRRLAPGGHLELEF